MSSRSRFFVFVISTPLVILVAVGGLLGAARAPQQAFPHLRVFEEVVSLILGAYVENVDIDKVMEGAMRGLADGLDPSSAYLTPEEVRAVEAKTALPPAGVGVVVSRQFYLRVVGVRDGSPAARGGLRTGDFIRGIDGKPTRDLSAFAGTRMLRGPAGSKISLTIIRGNAAEPHTVDLVREAASGDPVTLKKLPGGELYVRIASFTDAVPAELKKLLSNVSQASKGAVIDLRGTADGTPQEGVAAARLFVKSGTLTTLAGRGTDKTVSTAQAGDGALILPVVLLVSNGTANAAEVFAAALQGNDRAELVGEPTAGIAAVQRLVKLPENRGLWMTYQRYLTPAGDPIHERGLRPNVGAEEPSVLFGEAPPKTDEPLNKAVERLNKKAA